MRKVLPASALVLFFCLPILGQSHYPLLHRQELLNAKTVYFEYCDPAINGNDPEWNLRLDYCYRKFTKKFRKWCQKGRACWELTMNRRHADLILKEQSTKRETRDSTAHSLCVARRGIEAASTGRDISCPPVRIETVTYFRATLTTRDGKTLYRVDTRAEDILPRLQKRLGKVAKNRP